MKMKSLQKLVIVGIVIAFIVYACSPSNYSEKSALLKLEKALGNKVNATHISALGYGVKEGDSYTQYFKLKCDQSELLRLASIMKLSNESYDKSGANTPEWLQHPDPYSSVIGLRGFSKVAYGSSVQMWHQRGYLYVKVSFWD